MLICVTRQSPTPAVLTHGVWSGAWASVYLTQICPGEANRLKDSLFLSQEDSLTSGPWTALTVTWPQCPIDLAPAGSGNNYAESQTVQAL